jgi:uncharacterized membrane protein YkvA (DUF1232 family)
MKPEAKAQSEARRVVGEILDRDDPRGAARDQRVVLNGFWPKLRDTAAKVPFAADAVAAFEAARDPETPLRAKAILFGALAYFIAPLDAMPDFLIGLGLTDDAAVLALVLATLGSVIKPRHKAAARRLLGLKPAPDA